jgi:small subunit ribosomal protein S18
MMNKKKKQKRIMPQVKLSCPFNNNPKKIDYKDVQTLKKYITTRGRIMGRIMPSSKTGVSARCQRKLSLSIKRARYMAMLPFAQYV